MSAEDYQRAAMIKSVSGETIPTGRELSKGELTSLMKICIEDKTPAGSRDAAIIAMLYSAGLRREEITSLNLGNYENETGKLTITGKRNKQRTAYMNDGSLDALNDWLIKRGDRPGSLFFSTNKAGKIVYRRPTPQLIYYMLKKRAKQAGIADFSPHDMRRTFIGDLLDGGIDISTVSKMAGHKNVNTTARYDRRGEKAKQKAAKVLHIYYEKENKS